MNIHTRRSLPILGVILIALVASLTVIVPTVFKDAAPQASAVSASCKAESKRVWHRYKHTLPPTSNERVAAKTSSAKPVYRMRQWFVYCPQKDGALVWKIGQGYRIPDSVANPCQRFQAVHGEFRFLPGGYTAHLVKGCVGHSGRKTKLVNFFVPEIIAPFQPGLDRLLSAELRLKGAWSGANDHHHTMNVTLRY